jgi:hypothetical protein
MRSDTRAKPTSRRNRQRPCPALDSNGRQELKAPPQSARLRGRVGKPPASRVVAAKTAFVPQRLLRTAS